MQATPDANRLAKMLDNRLVGKPENFRGRHLLSNIAKCAGCGGPLHAVARGRNNRLGYVCKANRVSGSCPNASSVPAAELHAAVIASLRATFTPESFAAYLASKDADESEVESRRAELAHLTDVVIPGLAKQEERLVDAIASGVALDVVRDRLKKVTSEREAAETKRSELETWQRDERADREQAEELRVRWADWSQALESDVDLARQVMAKALGGAPIYVYPGAEPRTWHYLGLASYEGIIWGKLKPGAFASFIPDVRTVAKPGAPPQAVREAIARAAKTEVGAVPTWAWPRRTLPPISGGSDAEFNESPVNSGPPEHRPGR